MRVLLIAPIVLLALVALHSPASAQPLTTAFTYQGELRTSGSPATGVHDMRFRLYDAPTGGNQVGLAICLDNIPIAAGRFTAALDFGNQFTGQQRFLEIDVRADAGLDCTNSAGFTTLSPRQPITAAPHAAFALNSATATTASTAANSTQFNGQPPAFYQNASNLSSGALPDSRLSGTYSAPISFSNPANTLAGNGAAITALNATNLTSGILDPARLPVPLTLGADHASHILSITNVSTASGSVAIEGVASATTGSVFGIVGRANGPGSVAVFAESTAGDALYAITPGQGKSSVVGIHTGSIGYGLYGQNNGSDGAAIFGYSISGSGATQGGLFRCNSIQGSAVMGQAASSTGTTYGGNFSSNSTAGIAVRGFVPASSGQTFGGYFESASTGGYGVYGRTTAASGANYGVLGQSGSTSGAGVWGYASINSGGNRGVHGQTNSAAGHGIYSTGNLAATGTKAFRIDHPQDPTNKYLNHYCAEGPEPFNLYSGKATLDASGEAIISLPSYFAAINRDPRYSLTPIGAPMPMLHIAAEIDDLALTRGAALNPGEDPPLCTFHIAGGIPHARVSWEVKALRNDRWVQTHGAPVESEKTPEERGYQHPDLYHLPLTPPNMPHLPPDLPTFPTPR
jgi:hypothetical protein